MVNYTNLSSLADTGINGILSFPNTGDYYFWAKIFFGLFLIFGFTFFFEEKKRKGEGNFLSSFAVSALVTIILSFFASLVGFVTAEVFIGIFVLGMLIIGIWFFKKEDSF